MSASYLLLKEPWIPATDQNGTVTFFGIRSLLEQAHRLQRISDPSPMVEYGLYRLLVVFLMDALRPQDEDKLEELLDTGQFDMDRIDAYIAMCQEEGSTFDLFDPERPFLQTPFCAQWDKEMKPVSVLDYTIPTGNNHTHFDHRRSGEIALSYGQAARLLPALQLFCTAGVQGYPSGVNGAPPYFSIIQGESLFETLIFSLLIMDDIRIKFADPPVIWRSDIPIEPKKPMAQTSWLYGMLFPARRVLLIPNEANRCVAQIYLSQGMNYTATDLWTDPHVAYRVNKQGRFPWRPNQERAVWRNINDLIESNHTPLIVRQYKKYIGRSNLLHILLYGVQTDQASYITALHYDLKLLSSIIENPEAGDFVRSAITQAETLERALKGALTHPDIPPSTVFQATQNYYDRCGKMLLDMCGTQMTGEDTDWGSLNQAWLDTISKYACDALNAAMERISLRGKSLVEVTKQLRILFAEIRKQNERTKL